MREVIPNINDLTFFYGSRYKINNNIRVGANSICVNNLYNTKTKKKKNP